MEKMRTMQKMQNINNMNDTNEMNKIFIDPDMERQKAANKTKARKIWWKVHKNGVQRMEAVERATPLKFSIVQASDNGKVKIDNKDIKKTRSGAPSMGLHVMGA